MEESWPWLREFEGDNDEVVCCSRASFVSKTGIINQTWHPATNPLLN